MWNLNFTKLASIIPNLGTAAIETGTCRGNGTRTLAQHFPRVITIELSEELSREAKKRLSGSEFSHVEFIAGDSSAELRKALNALQAEKSIFIFLDAHWSGDQSVAWEKDGWQGYGLDTAHRGAGTSPSGPEQCPLAEELAIIAKHWPGRAHVLIDDTKNIPLSGPGLKSGTFPGEDWSHLSRERLLSIVNIRLEQFYELEGPQQWLLVLSPQEPG
jgi:hypothetical protein